MKILITGGHLTPALAVIEKLKKIPGIEVLYIGRKYSIEGNIELSQEYLHIAAQKIRFLSINTGRLQRSFTKYTIISLAKIPLGFFQALMIIGRENPDCILSFGGYVAAPVCFAAWLKRIPIFTHEQTITSGLTNRIIGRLAKRIFISWPQTQSLYPKSKVVLTGNPLREEIFKINDNLIPFGLKEFGSLPLIYITGGSQGSESINNLILPILDKLLDLYRVIHQFGQNKRTENKIKERILFLTEEQKKRYFAAPFVNSKSIGWVFKNADLVIGRSGANTVSELLVYKKPSLLIPLPWAGNNEQEKNAQILVEVGLGKILHQKMLSPESLFENIKLMLSVYKKSSNQRDSKIVVNNHAAQKIITTIVAEIRK